MRQELIKDTPLLSEEITWKSRYKYCKNVGNEIAGSRFSLKGKYNYFSLVIGGSRISYEMPQEAIDKLIRVNSYRGAGYRSYIFAYHNIEDASSNLSDVRLSMELWSLKLVPNGKWGVKNERLEAYSTMAGRVLHVGKVGDKWKNEEATKKALGYVPPVKQVDTSELEELREKVAHQLEIIKFLSATNVRMMREEENRIMVNHFTEQQKYLDYPKNINTL